MASLDELVNTSKAAIEAIISKPKMTEKLLSKPPFRFLHDTFMAITAANGFADGLYTDEEKDSANVQEKQQKIDFLNKMIACVGICLGSSIDVRAAKIVAGAECENTNVFLAVRAGRACRCPLPLALTLELRLNFQSLHPLAFLLILGYGTSGTGSKSRLCSSC
jgi:hypothetical protein